jgi:hypothetical protein
MENEEAAVGVGSESAEGMIRSKRSKRLGIGTEVSDGLYTT